jgi:hypothetical protein
MQSVFIEARSDTHTQTSAHRGLSVREIQSLRRSRPFDGRPLGEWHAAEDASLDSQLIFSWAPAYAPKLYDQTSNKVLKNYCYVQVDSTPTYIFALKEAWSLFL